MSSEAIALWTETSSDPELIAGVRAGDSAAFGVLYKRHADAARKVASQYTNSHSDVDDVVSEAFSRVLRALQRGDGPDLAFRAYLFTIVRRTGMDIIDKGIRTKPRDDMSPYESAIGYVASSDEPALDGFEHGMVADAFKSLPERWQAVLWYTEVEKKSPREIAPLLGLSANGVAALAYRAREALRQAYLQQHLNTSESADCLEANTQLGAYVRGGLSKREHTRIDAHVRSCERCSALVAELEDVNRGMRGIIAPLFMGVLGAGALEGGLPIGGAFGAQTVAAAGTTGAGGAGAASAGAAGASGAATGSGLAGLIGVVTHIALPAAAVVGVATLALNGASVLGWFTPEDGPGGADAPVVTEVSPTPSPSETTTAGESTPTPTPAPSPSIGPSPEPSAAPEAPPLTQDRWWSSEGETIWASDGRSDNDDAADGSNDGQNRAPGTGSDQPGNGQPGDGVSGPGDSPTDPSGPTEPVNPGGPGTPGPAPVDPTPVGPGTPGPAPVDPAPVGPGTPDPTPVDPAPVGPGTPDPTPVDPAPVDPVPTTVARLAIGKAPLDYLEISRTAPSVSLSVANQGDGSAESVTADITLPEGLVIVGPEGGAGFAPASYERLSAFLAYAEAGTLEVDDWQCTVEAGASATTCVLDSIAPGATATLNLDVAIVADELSPDSVIKFDVRTGDVRDSYSVRTALAPADDTDDNPLDPGYSDGGGVAVQHFGGTVMGCFPPSQSTDTDNACRRAMDDRTTDSRQGQSNNDWNMRPLNDDGGVKNSGTTAISLPEGATVKAAYLEWSANRYLSDGKGRKSDTWSGNLNTARLKVGDGDFTTVIAETVDDSIIEESREYYLSRADVTELVAQADGEILTIADIAISETQNERNVKTYYGGFTLTVVYEDPAQPATSTVALFEGPHWVSGSAPVSIRFNASAGATVTPSWTAYEGDRGSKGDVITIGGDNFQPLSQAGNHRDSGDVADSTAYGSPWGNTLGIDAKRFSSKLIQAPGTHTVKASTSGDNFMIGTFAITIVQPADEASD